MEESCLIKVRAVGELFANRIAIGRIGLEKTEKKEYEQLNAIYWSFKLMARRF